MKKLLHVAEPFASGVLNFLIDITKRQVEEYDVYILYGVRPMTPVNVDELFDKRVHLIKMTTFHGALGTVFNPKAYWDVYQEYKRLKPDIVHLHSSASGFVGRWALPCTKIPVFYTPHGYSFLMQDASKAKRLFYWLIEYISALRPCKTIACSEGEYKEALRLSSNATYVNNGINVSELLTYVHSTSSIKGPVKIGTSGRISYQKNPSLFNQIAMLLPELEFVWIGDGELRAELIAPNIVVTGWKTREEVLKIMYDINIFILPSLWEGLPISLLEAMFLKKICLVSNVIGNRDVIKSEENGLICNTAIEYAENIHNILNGKIDGGRLAENAHQDVLHNYNADLMSEKYSEIYNASLNNSN